MNCNGNVQLVNGVKTSLSIFRMTVVIDDQFPTIEELILYRIQWSPLHINFTENFVVAIYTSFDTLIYEICLYFIIF